MRLRTDAGHDGQGGEGPSRELEVDGAPPARAERLPRLVGDDDALEDIEREDNVHGHPDGEALAGE